ncbi:MAG: NapC/NirT family cytochrome c [Anaerolineae bacterium]
MFRIELRGLGRLDALSVAGHLLALLAVVGLFLTPAAGPAILVTAGLGLAYTALTWRARRSAYLYPAAVLLTAAYLLAVGLVSGLEAMFLWALPLQLAFLAAGAGFRRSGGAAYAAPLEVAAHLASLYLAGMLLWLSPPLRLPVLVIAALALLAAIDLGLARLHRERWYLFAAAVFLALAYLFALRFAPGGAPAAFLAYFTGAALVYGLWGWWLRRSRGADLAEPVEAAALLVGIAGGLAGLREGTALGLNALLVGAVAFGILFVSSRGAEYIYLSMLSAGAIGFQFVRIAGDRFSPELTDQFLVGLAILGVVFFYPVVRSLVRRGGSLRGWLNDGGWVRVFLVGLPLAILIPVIGVSYSFEATANPTFCGSCHVMQEQYQAWNRSPHRTVTCDTCHYPPGVELFVQGKVVGLTEVVNNLAGTFGTKPHGTVDNANCEDCHPRAGLIGVEAPYRGDIKFNHTELAPGNEYGITMRCNNCHAHIVDGFHFQVRESTCYWCHFMGREGQSTAVGDCFTCHETPRDETHVEVIAATNERDCTGAGCHASVTVGDGGVRPERCLACHGQIDPRAGEGQPMHELHIFSETTFLSRKVECLECHDEITHGEETFEEREDLSVEDEPTS